MSASASAPFSLRVRLGQCEVEISGSRDDVLKTVQDLQGLIAVVAEAFSQSGVDLPGVSSPVESSDSAATASGSAGIPSIQSSGNCSDAVLKLLSTDWGRGTPRTLTELVEAMRANAIHFPATTLSGVLNWLVRKGRVKRWKTDKGYVYVLAGSEVAARGQARSKIQSGSTVASSGG